MEKARNEKYEFDHEKQIHHCLHFYLQNRDYPARNFGFDEVTFRGMVFYTKNFPGNYCKQKFSTIFSGRFFALPKVCKISASGN